MNKIKIIKIIKKICKEKTPLFLLVFFFAPGGAFLMTKTAHAKSFNNKQAALAYIEDREADGHSCKIKNQSNGFRVTCNKKDRSSCATANRYTNSEGQSCGEALAIHGRIEKRQEQLNNMQNVTTAALELWSAGNPVRDQKGAYRQMETTGKTAVAFAGIQTAFHIHSIGALSKAEKLAKKAEDGINSSYESYDLAKRGLKGEQLKAIEDSRSRKEVEGKIFQRSGALLTKAQIANLPENAGKFSNYGEYESKAEKGVNQAIKVKNKLGELKEVATLKAFESGLLSAIHLSHLSAVKDAQKGLTTLGGPGPRTYSLRGPTQPREDSSGHLGYRTETGADNYQTPSEVFSTVPDEIEGGIKLGEAFNVEPSKPRSSLGSGGVGGASLIGGSDPGRGRDGGSKESGNFTRAVDYAGAGASLSNMGSEEEGSSDVQDAIRSLLGNQKKEKEEDDDAIQFFNAKKREIASLQDKQDLENIMEEDRRTIFERVKEKYMDVVNRGIL